MLLVIAGRSLQAHDGQLFCILVHVLTILLHHLSREVILVQVARAVDKERGLLIFLSQVDGCFNDSANLAEFLNI